ncbi:hypothetical protein IMCC26134_03590 [Verrucomicrobia bacterium IMCC26134]|nr:hypothetical protein IMCC26134_03590 [Verrucomicrobia bacterium IMCC26134]
MIMSRFIGRLVGGVVPVAWLFPVSSQSVNRMQIGIRFETMHRGGLGFMMNFRGAIRMLLI